MEKGACVTIQPLSALPGGFFGAWCNGSTPDFESVDPGSNPGAPAEVFLP